MSQSLETEDLVRNYCLHHPLSKPKIAWRKSISVIVGCLTICSLCAYLSQLWVGSFWINLDLISFCCVLSFGKSTLIFLVQLYQHFASESKRRQCHCMPSCSEYALLALNKYIWPKALWLIFIRLVKTCQLPGYKLDYP